MTFPDHIQRRAMATSDRHGRIHGPPDLKLYARRPRGFYLSAWTIVFGASGLVLILLLALGARLG